MIVVSMLEAQGINGIPGIAQALPPGTDISSINTHLDWYYNKENEEKFTWTLNTNDNYINIMLLKVGTMWEIIDDYRESLYVETKAKGYRAIRDIIKKYEKIALL